MINYNFKDDIKLIRTCFELSQEHFAEYVELSRSNIARYEAGQIQPRNDAAEKIYNYAFSNGFDINKAKSMLYEDNKENYVVLYHGSRGEILGDVDNKHSVGPNDFGNGFYLGESLKQANMWVAGNKHSSTYCFLFEEKDRFNKLVFGVDYNWMMAILYYRGALRGLEIPKSLKELINKIESVDYIVAPIADNQMYDTLELFVHGFISDEACLHALNANNLGKQYIMKSMEACNALIPLDRLYICSKEREYYLSEKEKSTNEGKSKSLVAIAKYRKKGKMFNEIFQRKE